jgi:hypothetical protein
MRHERRRQHDLVVGHTRRQSDFARRIKICHSAVPKRKTFA